MYERLTRLLQLMAEDLALEDTLYQLGRALYAERLPLDRFLKVRCLAYTARPHPLARAVYEARSRPKHCRRAGMAYGVTDANAALELCA